MPTTTRQTVIRQRDETTFASETSLAHPARDVFAAVMSPEIAPLVDPAVRRWEPDSRPIAVGTQFTIRGRLQWLPVRATSRVTVWEPPVRGEFAAVRPTRPLRLYAFHSFEEHDGVTRYTWSMTVHHPGVVGRFLTRRLGTLIERTLADQARTLAAWLDENPDAAAAAHL